MKPLSPAQVEKLVLKAFAESHLETEDFIEFVSKIVMNEKHDRNMISITLSDLKQTLQDTFDREATDKEAEDFKEYLDLDLGTWLSENARTFTQKLVDEGKF